MVMMEDVLRRIKLYIGAFIGFGAVVYISFSSNHILLAPLAASACILFAVPESQFARAKNVIFGHMLSAAIGVTAGSALGEHWWAAAICVTLAVAVMDVTDTMHPPAAATSLIAFATEHGYYFILSPVASDSVLLVATAYIVRIIFCLCRENKKHE